MEANNTHNPSTTIGETSQNCLLFDFHRLPNPNRGTDALPRAGVVEKRTTQH
jgi:hypothetical protein